MLMPGLIRRFVRAAAVLLLTSACAMPASYPGAGRAMATGAPTSTAAPAPPTARGITANATTAPVAQNSIRFAVLGDTGTGERAQYGFSQVSPDGTKAAVVLNVPPGPQGTRNNDVWIVDLVKNTSTRFTFDPGADVAPVWSPDGKWIAWISGPNKQPGFFRKAADGSGVDERLNAYQEFSTLTDWTQNGYLIYTSGDDIWALPIEADATGTRTPVAVVKSAAQERDAQDA